MTDDIGRLSKSVCGPSSAQFSGTLSSSVLGFSIPHGLPSIPHGEKLSKTAKFGHHGHFSGSPCPWHRSIGISVPRSHYHQPITINNKEKQNAIHPDSLEYFPSGSGRHGAARRTCSRAVGILAAEKPDFPQQAHRNFAGAIEKMTPTSPKTNKINDWESWPPLLLREDVTRNIGF